MCKGASAHLETCLPGMWLPLVNLVIELESIHCSQFGTPSYHNWILSFTVRMTSLMQQVE